MPRPSTDGLAPANLQSVRNPVQRPALYFAIVPLAAFLRLFKLGGKQLWVDEILQVIHSSPSTLKGILLGVTDDRGAAPLDYLVQHLVMALLGRSEFSARLHAALFGILAVIVLYYLAEKIFDRPTATIASLLYAVYPLHHHYSQEGRPYALFVFLTLCSYGLFLKLLSERKTRYWVYYAVVAVVLLYTHYYGFLVIGSQFLFLCAMLLPKVERSFLPLPPINATFRYRFLAVAIGAALLLIPWLIFGFKTIYGYMPSPEHFNWKLLARLIKELSDGSYPLSALLLSLAALGILRLKAEQKYGHLLFLLWWFLLPVLLILFILWMRNYFFAIRQILFTTPALFIMVAYGILHLSEICTRSNARQRPRARALITAVVAAASLLIIVLHIPDRRDDLKGAGRFLAEDVANGDLVIAPDLAGILSYYFPTIYTHAQDISLLQDVNQLRTLGHRIYIVKSRHLSTTDRIRLQELEKLNRSQQIINFRGLQIVKIY